MADRIEDGGPAEAGLVGKLLERAGIARGEGNATATADAWHFEQAAAEITRLRAEVERKDGALQTALDALDALAFIHDGNPSDAMADMPATDYARHMLWEARKLAKAAASEARARQIGLSVGRAEHG